MPCETAAIKPCCVAFIASFTSMATMPTKKHQVSRSKVLPVFLEKHQKGKSCTYPILFWVDQPHFFQKNNMKFTVLHHENYPIDKI